MNLPAAPASRLDVAVLGGGGPGAIRAALATLSRNPHAAPDSIPEAALTMPDARVFRANLREAVTEVGVLVLTVSPVAVLWGEVPVLDGAIARRLHGVGLQEIHAWPDADDDELDALATLLLTAWSSEDPTAFLDARARVDWRSVNLVCEAPEVVCVESPPPPVNPSAAERVRTLLSRNATAPPVQAQPAQERRREPARARRLGVPTELATHSVVLADFVVRSLLAAGPQAATSSLHALAEQHHVTGDTLDEAMRDLVGDVDARARTVTYLHRAELPRDAGWLFAFSALVPASVAPTLAASLAPAHAAVLVDEVASRPGMVDTLLELLRAGGGASPNFTLACAARTEDERLAEPVAWLTRHADPGVRVAALDALHTWKGTTARAAAQACLDDADGRVRAAARRLAGATG